VLSLAAAAWPPLGPVVLALDALCAAALAVDVLRTPSPARLGLLRSLPRRVGLSGELLRLVRFAPGRAAGFLLELREDFPPSFAVLARAQAAFELRAHDEPLLAARGALLAPAAEDPTGGPDRLRLPDDAAREIAVPRVYRPDRRGRHALGDLRLRLRSPWGLVWRQTRLEARQEVEVVPALRGLRRTLRLAASRRWHELGVRRLRRRGVFSSDFESLRPYVHGDDARLVDWKATARRGAPAVRQFQVERGQELVLLVDCGRRMSVEVAGGAREGWSKLDHALDAALELAAVALQQGDRVGLCAYDQELRAWVPPGRDARALERLLEASFALEPRPVESDLGRALREVRARHRRRALLVVLSDVGDAASVERLNLGLRSAGGRPLVFAALDDPDVRDAAAGAQPPGRAGSALRAAALAEELVRARALARLAAPRLRVLDALPAEAAGPLLGAWLDARAAR
jgi:uncharacterized protein (DUF58 family)